VSPLCARRSNDGNRGCLSLPRLKFLKYGARWLGLAILIYTGALLKLELLPFPPRNEARNLILIYMGFSLIAFAGGGYLESPNQSASMNSR